MAIIKKKIWPEYFELVSSGKKKFELRLADFDVKEGDALSLEEWDPKTREIHWHKFREKSKFCFEIVTIEIKNLTRVFAGV